MSIPANIDFQQSDIKEHLGATHPLELTPMRIFVTSTPSEWLPMKVLEFSV